MRKLSMKKFGTPIGAAPGSVKLNAFAAAADAAPLFLAPAFVPLPLPAGFLPEVPGVLWWDVPDVWLEVWLCVLWCCWWGWPVWWGGVWVWLLVVVVDVELDDVEVEVEDDEDEDDEEEPEPLEPLPVVVVVGGGAHDSELETTPAGRLSAESDVPAGWLGNVRTWPVISFTVIVHVSA